MLIAKDAVAVAARYMADIYGKLDGLLVEEVELESDSKTWLITMGYWLALPAPPPNPLNPFAATERPKVRRVYKLLRVAENGDVLSMKIRELKGPE